MAGSRLTVAMASPCSGRMKLDSSVSMALTSHSASTAQHSARSVSSRRPLHLEMLHSTCDFHTHTDLMARHWLDAFCLREGPSGLLAAGDQLAFVRLL